MNSNGSQPTSKFGKLKQSFKQKVEDFKIKRSLQKASEEEEKKLFQEEKREARKEFIKKTAKKAAKQEVEQQYLRRGGGKRGAVMGILNAFDISQASNRIVRTQVRKKGRGKGRGRRSTVEVGRVRDTSDIGDDILFGSGGGVNDLTPETDIIFGNGGNGKQSYDPVFGAAKKRRISEREFLGFG